jgi:murein DD-endopeptidase MepM/ murein hydrolase activator NlpD
MAINARRGRKPWRVAGLLIVLAGFTGGLAWLNAQSHEAPGPEQPVEDHSQNAAVSTPAPALAGAPPVREEVPANPEPVTETPRAAPVPEMIFQLPTKNDALFRSQPDQFFMFVDRYTPGGQVQVWEGGSYGFVRNERQTPQGTIYTKFHEGIDILPVERDAKGEPLDEVEVIADGIVGYITSGPRTSNYGNYVVVLHQAGTAGVFYSLYAHLRSITVVVGTPIKRGRVVGQLGYTGDGIDRRRAHVHLEIGLILSGRFDAFFGAALNGRGNFHGSNLAGINAATFLMENHKNPLLMPHQFLQSQEIYYKVQVPNRGQELDLVIRYPWLRKPGTAGASWEISFTGPGVPLAVAPLEKGVTDATVSWVKPFPGSHAWNTRSMLTGSGNTAVLTREGSRFLKLVAGDF